MSEAHESKPRRGFGGGCILLFVISLPILFVMMMAGIGQPLIELAITFLFGWVSFLIATIPKISWNGQAVLFSFACLGLILWLGHQFATWLSANVASARGMIFVWPAKWTFCSVAIVGIGFLVAMLVAGAAHQIGWVLGSPESLFDDRFGRIRRGYSTMSAGEFAVQDCLIGATTVDAFRGAMRGLSNNLNSNPSADRGLDAVHLLMLVGSDNALDAVLIFPRDPETQRRLGGKLVKRDTASVPLPVKELRPFIEKNEGHLLAF